jgi:hypothetical protein
MRKKTHLTLYKRFKRYAPSKLSTPTKSPSKKRQRVSTSHQTPSKSIKKSSTSPSYVASKLQSPWKHPPSASKWIDVETENNENTEEDCKHLNTFKRELENYGLWQYFKLFIDLVSKQMYPLDNIAMLLFLDTVKFFGSKSTTCMKYFPETKRFWKSGYRLFHAKFLYYMGGPKNVGVKEENQRDHIDPSAARINFAVPSINVIEEFVVSESSTSMSKKMPAGVIEPIIESIQMSVQDKRFMLCADAKKVTAGIDRQGGDVDLFGFEDGETLAERQKRLSNELQSLKEIEEKVTSETNLPKPDLAAKLRESVTMIGKRIQEARDLKSRQEFGLNKFVALGGEKWRESKYIYAISALHTSLYRLNEFLSTALSTSYRLCRATTLLSKPICSLVDDLVVMKGHQENMIFLNPDLQTDILEPRHTLQRTPTWNAVRKLAPVTGSTIHDAIGLRGLQQQKKHITKISNTNDPEVFPEDVLTRMEYGTINEGNALATLAAIVIPTFFPNCVYVEEGCFLKQGDTKDILMVISPDGSLREFQSDMKSTADTGKVVAAVELKCPYPKENKVLLHYSLPQYYVCQCLAEMYSLGTNRLVYLSWSPESSVVLEVLFDADLFSLIYSFIKETYDTDIPKRPAHAPA